MSESFIDSVSSTALSSFDQVMTWLGLDGGKREGREYLPVNPKRNDSKPGSLSINRETGVWSDFATGDKGGDLVSLAAYIQGCKQGEAARALAGFLGLQASSPQPLAGPQKSGNDGECCIPVPDNAPPVPLAHMRNGKPERRYTYTTAGGKVAFYVDRYATKEGKSFAQLTVWKNAAGALQWRWKSPPSPRLLYGLHDLTARSDAPVMVCEGEKATEAARVLFPGFVVVCWPGGAQAVGMSDFSPLVGRNVTLWPDFDESGRAAMVKVSATLNSLKSPPVALYTVKPEFFGLSERGADAADIQGWDAERCAAACAGGDWRESANKDEKPKGRQREKPAAITHGAGRFILKPDGVYFVELERDGMDVKPKWICSRLEVLAYSRDGDSRGWGLLVRFSDPDGREHRLLLPTRLFLGEGNDVLRMLKDEGLRIGAGKPAKTRLIEYLETANPANRLRTANRTGWHDTVKSRVFVLPDCAYGAVDGETWHYENDSQQANPFQTRETLPEWRKHVAALCAGNSRLVFAVSVAFAAPLLEPAAVESGGFHFRGKSSDGKTTALRVACSVAGGREYMQRWRATDNALESIAVQHSDSLLALDELAQIDPRTAGEAAYMLANGSAKARATRTGAAKPSQSWRTLFLSAGEISLSQHVAECGKATRAGQEVRFVDIPADAGAGYGAWENLHDYKDGAELSKALKHACDRFYGVALRAFLSNLSRNGVDVTDYVRGAQKQFAARFVPDKASNQVSRVSDRFALAAAGGELATQWGITGWGAGEATAAAGKCFADWLNARGSAGDYEEAAMLSQVRGFLEQYGASSFDLWHRLHDDHSPKTVKRVGVARWVLLDGTRVKTATDKGGEEFKSADYANEFFVYPEAWRDVICKGFDPLAVARVLHAAGYLVCSNEEDGRLTTRVRIPGMGNKRVYHIKHTFMSDGCVKGVSQTDEHDPYKPPF